MTGQGTPGTKNQWVAYTLLLLIFVHGGANLDHSVQEAKSIKLPNETTLAIESKKPDISSPLGVNGKVSASQGSLTFDCKEADVECLKDKLGYEAIKSLHRLIDDDNNGNVDQSESDEFLRDELQYTDGFERHSLFHNNDKFISVDDLWKAWKFSEVYNWTKEDVIDWLEKEVDLPQYSTVFLENSVSGPSLPRLAASNTYMSTALGIKNPVHKQKLSLKAMDTVLFGAPPKRHNYIKDLVLVASLIFAIGGCWFAYLHHRFSQEQVRKLMIDLESLQKAEEALMDMQRKLEDAEKKQVSGLTSAGFQNGTENEKNLPSEMGEGGEGTRLIQEELQATLLALQHAENRLEQHPWSPPGELQAWLQLTHELEQLHYSAKRQAAERQFQAAKESCDKIKKRNKAFFGSLRMAHTNSLDEIDQRILDARMALEEVKQDLQERLFRWHTIEGLCGFSILSNPGLPTLQQLLHGASPGASTVTRLPSSLVGPVSVDEADEDLPPAAFPCSMPNGLSRPRALSTEIDVASLPYALIPDNCHVEKEKASYFRSSRRRHQHSYHGMPTVPSKNFLRLRPGMGSTGSLSHLARATVNPGAYSSIHSQTGGHSFVGSIHGHSLNDSLDQDSPSPTSGAAINPVTFHLGDQAHLHQDRIAAMSNMNHHHHYHTLPSSHRSFTINPVSSTPLSQASHSFVSVASGPSATVQTGAAVTALPGSAPHNQTAQSSFASSYSTGQASSVTVFSHSKSVNVSDSDDNVSQTTMDSLPSFQSSAILRDRGHTSNGVDHGNHSVSLVSDDSSLALGGVKKPSKKKKILGLFRKTQKQKSV